jgi:hypothetical protein
MFQDNGNNPNVAANTDALVPEMGEPPDLHISVDLSESRVVATIPEWVVIVYLVMSTAVYSCCVGAMFLSFRVQGPPISSFEMIDFASRIVSNNRN